MFTKAAQEDAVRRSVRFTREKRLLQQRIVGRRPIAYDPVGVRAGVS